MKTKILKTIGTEKNKNENRWTLNVCFHEFETGHLISLYFILWSFFVGIFLSLTIF
jgi:hypothetical protein